MKRLMQVLALMIAVLVSGVIVHPYFDFALQKERSAFHLWLDKIENQRSLDSAEGFRLRIGVKTAGDTRAWEFDADDATGPFAHTILRALQLIEAAKLYETSQVREGEYLEVVLESKELKFTTRTPWSNVLRNMPAQNLMTLLHESSKNVSEALNEES